MMGTVCGPGGPSACELDRLGCDEPEVTEFYLASCPADVTGPLEVEIGSGESGFAALDEGGPGPEIHYGAQGGQHIFLGFKVGNARLDVSPLVRARFYFGEGECVPPTTDEEASCTRTLGQRELTLGSPGFEVHTNMEGDIEEFGLLLFSDYPTGDPGIVSVVVEDPCMRKGVAFIRHDPQP
jgi:hypothetical protein